MLSTLENIAAEKKKIPALTEFGFNEVPDSTWWTKAFWQGIGKHKISYALAWRNAGYKPDSKTYEYYVPYIGQTSAKDFFQFYKLDKTLFQSNIRQENIYKGK